LSYGYCSDVVVYNGHMHIWCTYQFSVLFSCFPSSEALHRSGLTGDSREGWGKRLAWAHISLHCKAWTAYCRSWL